MNWKKNWIYVAVKRGQKMKKIPSNSENFIGHGVKHENNERHMTGVLTMLLISDISKFDPVPCDS
jgi:hypothetical protein